MRILLVILMLCTACGDGSPCGTGARRFGPRCVFGMDVVAPDGGEDGDDAGPRLDADGGFDASSTHACDLHRKARSKTLCNLCVDPENGDCKARPECVSNDECQAGQACVDVPAGAGLKVCQKVRDISACPRPYIGETTTPVSSADGPAVKVCTFRTGTTCQAHADYSNKRCGTPKNDNPAEDQLGSGDDTECGAPESDDGYCVLFGTLNQYLCTVPCNNSVADCPTRSTSCNDSSLLCSL